MSRMTGPDCVVMCNLINTYIHTVTAGECNWRHFGWLVRLVGFPQCYLACRFLTNKMLHLAHVWEAYQN